MISDAASLDAEGEENVSQLLAWRPEHGVLSVYLRLDPGQRSPKWPTEVRNDLSATLSADRKEWIIRRARRWRRLPNASREIFTPMRGPRPKPPG